ncbi:hypothetical protein [Streptomyces canus]|uniref:hypothetical protein n=1 Tax=Streptomyces canus TaxID=58343 RepID=UPI00131A2AD9|nr:hypothetical protein [Streptomyces canus]
MTTGNDATQPVPAEPQPPGQPRDASNQFASTITQDERAASAARLKAANPRMTYQQIADQLGYSDKGNAWRAIQKCRQAVLRQAGAELVASQAAQLDNMFVAAMEVLERDHVVVSHGKVITMPDEDGTERPLVDDGPKLAAIREMRAINESYRKLLGVDQPQQVAVSGSVRYEVVGVDTADLT